MSNRTAARTTIRRTSSITLSALAVLIAALIGVHLYQAREAPASPVATTMALDSTDGPDIDGGLSPPRRPPTALGTPRAIDGKQTQPARALPEREQRRDAPGVEDGAVPDGVTVFDDGVPAVANLRPTLLDALRRAATDAEEDGVTFYVTSGWRSPAYQEQLRREAVARYGSEKEAARWVAAPSRSAHVSGDAVDIGPANAMAWLSKHGKRYGLCLIYRNEP